MLTSYTSSDEENIPYLRKDRRYRWLACVLIALQVVRTSCPGSRPLQFPCPPPPPPNPPGPEMPLKKIFYSQCFIIVFIQYNEGLQNKLTRAPLLSLAGFIYYLNVFFLIRRSHISSVLNLCEGGRVTLYVSRMRSPPYIQVQVSWAVSMFCLDFLLHRWCDRCLAYIPVVKGCVPNERMNLPCWTNLSVQIFKQAHGPS